MQYKHRQGLSCYSFPIRLHYLFISNNDDKINHQNKENLSKFITRQSMFSNTDSRKKIKDEKQVKKYSTAKNCISKQLYHSPGFLTSYFCGFFDSHFPVMFPWLSFSLPVKFCYFLFLGCAINDIFIACLCLVILDSPLCQLSLFCRAFKPLLFSPFKLNPGSFSHLVLIVAAEVNTVMAGTGAPLCRESHYLTWDPLWWCLQTSQRYLNSEWHYSHVRAGLSTQWMMYSQISHFTVWSDTLSSLAALLVLVFLSVELTWRGYYCSSSSER